MPIHFKFVLVLVLVVIAVILVVANHHLIMVHSEELLGELIEFTTIVLEIGG
jgi:hypothetical protein